MATTRSRSVSSAESRQERSQSVTIDLVSVSGSYRPDYFIVRHTIALALKVLFDYDGD